MLSGLSTSEQVDADVEQAVELAERCGDASTHAYVLQFAGAALLHSRSIDAGYRLFQQGVRGVRGQRPRLPSAGRPRGPCGCGRCGPGGSTGHADTLDVPSSSAGRSDVPGGRRSGSPGLQRLPSCKAITAGRRTGCPRRRRCCGHEPSRGSNYEMWLRHWLALSAYASGDLEAARATAAEIVRIGRGGGSRWDEAIGEWLLGVLAHGQERHDDARAHLEASRALSTDPRLPLTLGRSLLGLAELAREDEDLDEAWELAHDSLEVLDDYGDRVGAAAALETIADLAVALGEPERSLRLLAASQRFHTDTGIARFPFQADRFDRARSTAQAALDPTDATACWDAGGELSLADAVAYARRGRGERQRPQIGWASLTPVERDVVRLVAEGHTNAEIGQRLFISVNTVKKHLSHVYAKVDVDGRADLAAQVARRDL